MAYRAILGYTSSRNGDENSLAGMLAALLGFQILLYLLYVGGN